MPFCLTVVAKIFTMICRSAKPCHRKKTKKVDKMTIHVDNQIKVNPLNQLIVLIRHAGRPALNMTLFPLCGEGGFSLGAS